MLVRAALMSNPGGRNPARLVGGSSDREHYVPLVPTRRTKYDEERGASVGTPLSLPSHPP